MTSTHSAFSRFVLANLTPVGRMRRVPFVLTAIVWLVVFFGSILVFNNLSHAKNLAPGFSHALIFFPLLVLWPMFCIAARRLHDMGWPAWLELPYLFLYLLIVFDILTLRWEVAIGTWLSGHGLPAEHNILLDIIVGDMIYIPVADFILAVVPGSRKANRHGPGRNDAAAIPDVF